MRDTRKSYFSYNKEGGVMKNFELYTHQKNFVKMYPEKLYMAWEVGCGKTIGALATAKHNGFKKILIIAPKSAHLSWIRDNIHFNFNLTLDIVTYEGFRDKVDDVSRYDLVVFDEAHRLSYIKTKWTRKALELRPYMKNILMLSGTPADKFHKLYAQLKILTNGQDEVFKRFRSYRQFVDYFFELDEYNKPKKLKDKKYEEFFLSWFQQYADIVRRDDVVELPPISFYDVRLEEERLEYETGENDLANFIKWYKASALTKQKIEYVIEFLKDNKDTVVFSLFRSFVKQVKEKLGDKVYAITSETPRALIEQAIVRQDKPIVSTYLLSEGANLQTAYRNVIFASLPLKYIEYEQAIGRVYRTGQRKKVIVYRLMQNDIDHIVKSILEKKRDVVEYLKEIDDAKSVSNFTIELR